MRRGERENASSTLGGLPGGDKAVMADIPIRLLDSFIPGYSILSALILDTFGFDISNFVSAVFVLLTFVAAVRYVWKGFWGAVRPWCRSTVSVGSDDVIFDHLMFWVRKHSVSQTSRTLIASSKRSSWEADDPTDLLQIGKGAANYSPGYGTPHRFLYKGNYFTFRRESKEVSQVQPARRGKFMYTEQERIHLSCFGRSTKPIKKLISDAKAAYIAKRASTTTVRVPNSAFSSWTAVSTRPSRSMATLSLSQDQSSGLIKDISEYLAPASVRWYASRGIPYRRGYLFHGPPGTGKTSFSLVLAGMFGLDIHVLSLLDLGLTESKLQHLFLGMPSRCIVLLEDVDSAGFTRKKEGEGLLQSQRGRKDDEPETISLSCLLNVIDGVASHEGRILIMTTNYPERIDPRLVRAGRVDLKVLFGFATHEQIADLFIKMYDTATPPSSFQEIIDEKEAVERQLEKRPERVDSEYKELVFLAEEFATLLPENELTPAEIQGFLLMRRESPEKAMKEAGEWLVGLRAEREAARIVEERDCS